MSTSTTTATASTRPRRPSAAPPAPPLPTELEALLRRMRLPYLRAAAPDVLATAKAQRWDPAEVLRVLINEEVIGRDAATRRMRSKSANFRQDLRHTSRHEPGPIPKHRISWADQPGAGSCGAW